MTKTASPVDGIVECSLKVRFLGGTPCLPALTNVFSRLDSPTILGGSKLSAGGGRYSYFAACPADILELNLEEPAPLEKIGAAIGRYRLSSRPDGLDKGMFIGGWAGYFGYELCRHLERLPASAAWDVGMPLVRLCFYDRLVCVDTDLNRCFLMALGMQGETVPVEEKLDSLERLVCAASSAPAPSPGAVDVEAVEFSRFGANMSHSGYIRAVERIKRIIKDGTVYQVNFSRRFRGPFSGSAIRLFHWQNLYNPCPYAAYIDDGRFQVVSASPELFLRVSGGVVSTTPIKGTRPRLDENGPSASEAVRVNRRNFHDLAESDKEQAELNMIIDLERNDLGRVCVAGTIRVAQPRTIEAYPTVFHAAATIEGILRPGVGFENLLGAVFPGGSITGAPKVSAMEIIDELEPTARGVYTGSIGFIGIDGTACLNIAIRTIIIDGGRAFAQAGGGIVADSEPEAEWHETLVKARALLAGLEAVCPDPAWQGTEKRGKGEGKTRNLWPKKSF